MNTRFWGFFLVSACQHLGVGWSANIGQGYSLGVQFEQRIGPSLFNHRRCADQALFEFHLEWASSALPSLSGNSTRWSEPRRVSDSPIVVTGSHTSFASFCLMLPGKVMDASRALDDCCEQDAIII